MFLCMIDNKSVYIYNIMIINSFIHLSLYIHVYVLIMYIFLACMIEICRFMNIYILAMTNTMSIQLSIIILTKYVLYLICLSYI